MTTTLFQQYTQYRSEEETVHLENNITIFFQPFL